MAAAVCEEKDDGLTVVLCFTAICLSAAEAHFIIHNIGDDCTLASLHNAKEPSVALETSKIRCTQGTLAVNRHNYCPQKLTGECSKALPPCDGLLGMKLLIGLFIFCRSGVLRSVTNKESKSFQPTQHSDFHPLVALKLDSKRGRQRLGKDKGESVCVLFVHPSCVCVCEILFVVSASSPFITHKKALLFFSSAFKTKKDN